ncbi:hypothetical protein OnM2_066063, partial [Erysiphe neolycopersici]
MLPAINPNRQTGPRLIDTGCLSYGLCDSTFAQNKNLARLSIKLKKVIGFDGKISSQVNEVAIIDIDLDGHCQSKIFLCITPVRHYDMILGMPWIVSQDVRIDGPRSEMKICSTGIKVHSKGAFLNAQSFQGKPVQESATIFNHITRKSLKKRKVEVFAASMADINKALAAKQRLDPTIKLPIEYHEFLNVFDHKKADLLP